MPAELVTNELTTVIPVPYVTGLSGSTYSYESKGGKSNKKNTSKKSKKTSKKSKKTSNKSKKTSKKSKKTSKKVTNWFSFLRF
jgi:hypothetical protein